MGDFYERSSKYPHVEKEAARRRHEHFEQLRQNKLDLVRHERDALLQDEHEDQLQQNADNSGSLFSRSPVKRRAQSARPWRSPSSVFGAGAAEENPATLVLTDLAMAKAEEKRLERIKFRQQKEIKCMIECETKMVRLQLENARRSAEEARRKEEYHKALGMRRAQLATSKHAKEIERKKQEDREELERKARAKQTAEQARLQYEEEQYATKLRQQEALRRDQERAAKAEEFKRQTEALLQQQEDEVAANRQRMLERERHVQIKIENAVKQRQLEAIEKREKVSARIQHALMQNQHSLERRKHELTERQQTALERAREIQEKTLAGMKERSLKQKQEEQVRQKRLEAARANREQHASRLVAKRQEMEEKLSKLAEEKEKERVLQTIDKQLQAEEKMQNVERIKRVTDYARTQLLERILDSDERSREVKARRQALLEARQKIALDSLIRKHKIEQTVERLRRTNDWDKIEESLYAM